MIESMLIIVSFEYDGFNIIKIYLWYSYKFYDLIFLKDNWCNGSLVCSWFTPFVFYDGKWYSYHHIYKHACILSWISTLFYSSSSLILNCNYWCDSTFSLSHVHEPKTKWTFIKYRCLPLCVLVMYRFFGEKREEMHVVSMITFVKIKTYLSGRHCIR